MVRRGPYRSDAFKAFAKRQVGRCCIHWLLHCEERPGEELHHYGPKGMGQKASDLLLARVCKECHGRYQGKRRIGFERAGEIAVLEALEADNVDLLHSYVEHLENS